MNDSSFSGPHFSFLASSTLLLMIAAGCGGSYHSNPMSPSTPSNPSSSSGATFSVAAVKPAAGTTNVPLNSTIQITFSSSADAATVNATDIVVTDPKPVAGAVTYDSSSNSATFTPSAALVANSTYTVTVSGIKSSAGTALPSPFQAKFATVMPPPPAGGGTGGGGGGTSSPTTQYQAPLLNVGATSINGQVAIDTSGNASIQLTGAQASTAYAVQFCAAFNSNISTTPAPQCFSITSFTTDASGSVSATVKFPKSGNWAGNFDVNNSAGKTIYSTYLVQSLNNENFLSTLLPQTTTNDGVVTALTKQEPLTSGTITFKNGSLQLTIQGASANTTYYADDSETVYMDSSGTYELSTFTTDASGNGSSTTKITSPGGDLFQVGLNAMTPTSAGYIGGFAIPK